MAGGRTARASVNVALDFSLTLPAELDDQSDEQIENELDHAVRHAIEDLVAAPGDANVTDYSLTVEASIQTLPQL